MANMFKKITLILTFTCSITIFPLSAYAVHRGAGDMVCGGCHTMHNSQGNIGMEGNPGGSLILLRGAINTRAEMHKLCLQCHAANGSQANVNHTPHGQRAPIVHGNGLLNWDETKDFGKIGAGGDFFQEIGADFNPTIAGSQYALGYGHSVGLTGIVPPGNANNQTTDLTCTSCHSPHGTDTDPYPNVSRPNIYRNLFIMNAKPDFSDCLLCHDAPSDFRGSGYLREMKSWVGGITGKYGSGGNYVPVMVNGVAIWPVYNGDSSIAANNTVYDGILGTGDSPDGGMGSWCAKCHHNFHEVRQNANIAGEDWTRHPASKIMSNADISGAGVSTIDWAHYASMPAGYKLPLAYAGNAANINNKFYYADADNEYKVFCLTCHFAHGGPYYDGLRWNYLSAVSPSVVGNPIASNVGCQQCHNRGAQ